MKNIDILIQEHDIIMTVLQVFEEEAMHIKKYRKINIDKILSMLDFFKNYADTFHHLKEENHLFELLIIKGMDRNDSPVESLRIEHEQGRKHIKQIRNFINETEASELYEKIYKEINAFVNLLRNHIDKENNMIFIMAEGFITQEDDNTLTSIYTNIEKEQNDIEKYRDYAQKLIVENTL